MVKPDMSVTVHCECENGITFELSDPIQVNHSTGTTSSFRVLSVGELSIFLTDDQAEELFDELDKKLHEVTYVELEDKMGCLESENEDLKNEIERLQELLSDSRVANF